MFLPMIRVGVLFVRSFGAELANQRLCSTAQTAAVPNPAHLT